MLTEAASIGVYCCPIAHTIVRCIHTNLLGATKEVNMILNNPYLEHDDEDLDAPFFGGGSSGGGGGSATSSHSDRLPHRSAVGRGLNSSASRINNSNSTMMQHNNDSDSLLQALTYVAGGEHPLSALEPAAMAFWIRVRQDTSDCLIC